MTLFYGKNQIVGGSLRQVQQFPTGVFASTVVHLAIKLIYWVNLWDLDTYKTLLEN